MKVKKNVSYNIKSWFNTKFSKLTSQELCDRQLGESLMRSWDLKS